MATPKTTLGLPAPEPTQAVTKVTIRGRKYVFQELEIGEYDKLLKQATTEVGNPVTGEVDETIDQSLLSRLLILKSCVEPKLTAGDLSGVGTKMYRAFVKIVNELHYGDEPIAVEKDDDEKPAETPEGNAA